MRKFFSLLSLSIFFLYLNLTPVVRFEREKFFLLTLPPYSLITNIYKTSKDFIEVFTKVSFYKNENTLLKEKVANNSAEIVKLKELIKDSNYINEQKMYTNTKFVDAKLIGTKEINGNTLFIIDKGIVDGIEEKNTVVYKGYLIGNVYKAENSTSMVRTITSANIEIPAESLSFSSVGIYTCKDSSCFLDKVLTSSPLEVGDIVISSGVTEDYKRGFIIGTIDNIEFSPEEPFKKAILSYEINLSSISRMGVIINEK